MHHSMILVALTASGAAVRLAPPLPRSTIPLQRRSRVVPVLLAPSLSEDRVKTGVSSVADDRVTVSKLLALGRIPGGSIHSKAVPAACRQAGTARCRPLPRRVMRAASAARCVHTVQSAHIHSVHRV